MSCPYSLAGLEIPQDDDGDVLEHPKADQSPKLVNTSASALDLVRGQQLGTVFSPSLAQARNIAMPTRQTGGTPAVPQIEVALDNFLEVPSSIPAAWEVQFEQVQTALKPLEKTQAQSTASGVSEAIQSIQPWLMSDGLSQVTRLRSGLTSSSESGVEGVAETLYAQLLSKVQDSSVQQPVDVSQELGVESGDPAVAGNVNPLIPIVTAGSVAVLSKVLYDYNLARIIQLRTPHVGRGGTSNLFNFAEWLGNAMGTGTGPNTESEPGQFDESQEL